MEICWTDTDASMIKSWKYVGCILMHDEDLERSIAQGDLRKKQKHTQFWHGVRAG